MSESAHNQLMLLIDTVLRPIRTSAARKSDLREELSAHIFDVFERELASLGDERAALECTAHRFGQPEELAAQIQDSLMASSYFGRLSDWAMNRLEKTVIDHNRLYSFGLTLLGIYTLCGLALLVVLLDIAPEVRPAMTLPQWSLPWIAGINAFYLLAIAATLVFRSAWPRVGKRLTKAMNLLLVLAPPFGTAIGIYGLWKVDRTDRALAQS